MCVECGCESLGSSTGIANIPGGIQDVSKDGESGLTSEKRESYLGE